MAASSKLFIIFIFTNRKKCVNAKLTLTIYMFCKHKHPLVTTQFICLNIWSIYLNSVQRQYMHIPGLMKNQPSKSCQPRKHQMYISQSSHIFCRRLLMEKIHLRWCSVQGTYTHTHIHILGEKAWRWATASTEFSTINPKQIGIICIRMLCFIHTKKRAGRGRKNKNP